MVVCLPIMNVSCANSMTLTPTYIVYVTKLPTLTPLSLLALLKGNRPGVTQRVPEGLGSQISMTFSI